MRETDSLINDSDKLIGMSCYTRCIYRRREKRHHCLSISSREWHQQASMTPSDHEKYGKCVWNQSNHMWQHSSDFSMRDFYDLKSRWYNAVTEKMPLMPSPWRESTLWRGIFINAVITEERKPASPRANRNIPATFTQYMEIDIEAPIEPRNIGRGSYEAAKWRTASMSYWRPIVINMPSSKSAMAISK